MRVIREGRGSQLAFALTLGFALSGQGSACRGWADEGGPPGRLPARLEPAEPLPLVLRRVLPLALEGDGEAEFQPSGLLLWQGRLLTVSDKHDRAIYSVDLAAEGVNVRPFVRFEPPADAPPPLDYEGLGAAPHGGWLVASEAQSRVLDVTLDVSAAPTLPVRGRARWLAPTLRDVGAGCLGTPNAGLEGVTLAERGRILLAGEREPRCLIRIAASGDPSTAEVWSMQRSIQPFEAGRSADYSDLTQARDRLYALARNVHLIVRLEPTPQGGYREVAAFSYRHAEDDARYRYEDRTYGMAEGLAIGEHEIFVVLDNNGQAREGDPRDRRPLLFVFERPPEL